MLPVTVVITSFAPVQLPLPSQNHPYHAFINQLYPIHLFSPAYNPDTHIIPVSDYHQPNLRSSHALLLSRELDPAHVLWFYDSCLSPWRIIPAISYHGNNPRLAPRISVSCLSPERYLRSSDFLVLNPCLSLRFLDLGQPKDSGKN